ncbi:MAG: hypothetical protein KJ749_08510 [Planctomycetes bacterium]|nr:hypothetical protein [Planctomycetota bacterium]
MGKHGTSFNSDGVSVAAGESGWSPVLCAEDQGRAGGYCSVLEGAGIPTRIGCSSSLGNSTSIPWLLHPILVPTAHHERACEILAAHEAEQPYGYDDEDDFDDEDDSDDDEAPFLDDPADDFDDDDDDYPDDDLDDL